MVDHANKMWSGHTHRLQDGGECIRALGQFGETMRHETISNDQTQRAR